MRKFYFVLVSLALMATISNAQVSSIADLFGKYKFTADLEVVDNSYESVFSDDCEVTLTKSDVSYYPAMLLGFGGATGTMYIAEFDKEAQAGIVRNPNNSQWGGSLHMAFVEGNYPYNNDENNYSEIYLTYDAATTNLTYPDFSIVTVNHQEASAQIVATFKNVKLELIELENVEIPDIAGEWKYAGTLRNADLSPKGFTMNLTASDESLKNWNAELVFEGYEDNVINLPATFDGSLLTVPFDSVYISETDSIRFGLKSSATKKKGELIFAYANKTTMSFYSYFYVRKDSVKWDEATQAYKPAGPIRQVFTDYMEREDPDARDWTGTYKVSVAEDDMFVFDEEANMPSEFDVVIEKVPGGFAVTEILGFRMSDYNMSSLSFVPGEGDMSAEIKLSSWGSYISMWEDNTLVSDTMCYAYYQLTDINEGNSPISVTVNEDGSMSLGAFMVCKYAINGETYQEVMFEPVVAYSQATMAPVTYDWVGTHTVSAANVTAYDGNNYPNPFEMTVIYDENYGMYLVTSFLGNDVAALNYGGILFNVAEDGKSATLNCGSMVGGAYPEYLILRDMNGGNDAIKFVLNGDGTVSVDNFSVQHLNYNTDETSPAVLYEGVTISAKVTEPAAPQYRIKCDVGYLNIGNTEDHPTGPVGGVNVVEYADDNNQIFTIEDAGDGNVYLKSASGYYIYCHQWNVDGKESEKTVLTFEEVGENKFYIKQAGGYFKVENVGGVNYPFCDAAISIAAVWSLEEVGSTGIENVKGEDANINGVYDLSGRKLEQITAPGIYIVNGKKVLVK